MTDSLPGVQLSAHPLVAAKLSALRSKATAPDEFRRVVHELTMLLFAEASADWATTPIEVVTPLATCAGAVLARPVVAVPILRAGLGMLDAVLGVCPDANVGHVGIYRDEQTLRPVSYFTRLPSNIAHAQCVLLDPMLATGHSACEAIAILKAQGAASIQFICIVASVPGIRQLAADHPDVRIITAAIDPELDGRGYIVPGLGDAGDRYFGTT